MTPDEMSAASNGFGSAVGWPRSYSHHLQLQDHSALSDHHVAGLAPSTTPSESMSDS